MFKNLLKQWLFKEDEQKLKSANERLERLHFLQKEYYEDEKAKVTIEMMLKEKLKGLPKVVDYDDDEVMEEEGKLNFYRKAKDILDNPVFTAIVTRLATNQKELTWSEAKSLEEINFGRSWASGVIDVRDEVERLAAIYVEMTKKDGDFDKFDVLDN
jgi:hypothetical protein